MFELPSETLDAWRGGIWQWRTGANVEGGEGRSVLEPKACPNPGPSAGIPGSEAVWDVGPYGRCQMEDRTLAVRCGGFHDHHALQTFMRFLVVEDKHGFLGAFQGFSNCLACVLLLLWSLDGWS